MVYRVKQFFKGAFAWARKADYELLDEYLNQSEKRLFWELPCHERHHALDTAEFIRCNAADRPDKEALIKAALLHDIGKVGSGMGIFKKSTLVLIDKFLPELSRMLSTRINMFNIYYNHPEIGAEMLEGIGEDKYVVELVRYHHSSKAADTDGMEILKKADNFN